MHLLVAVFRRSVRLVKTLQRAVMALVEMPVLHNGQPLEFHGVERYFERVDGTAKIRCEAVSRHESCRLYQFSCMARFLVGEVYVRPPRETVLEIPLALPVAQ